MKRIVFLVISALILAISASAASFNKVQSYKSGLFTDISSDAWYAGDVKASYEFGLVNGIGGNKFDPNGTVTVAQAITLAARFHASYNSVEIGSADGEWYMPYVNYAIENKIVKVGQFDSFTRAAKRYEVAILFATALPEEFFKPLNYVNGIPDVSPDKEYYDLLMLLYKAGIAMGSDEKGTFNPDTNITRAEFSALINRVASPGMRLSKSFDTMPDEDAYFMVNAPRMNTHSEQLFAAPSGWLINNKQQEHLTDGSLRVGTSDHTKDDYSAIYRDFDNISSGRIILQFRGVISSADDGVYIGFADENKKLAISLKADYGYFTLSGKNDVKTSVECPTDSPREFAIVLNVDLDNSVMYAIINGKITTTAEIPKDITLSRIDIGSTKEGTGVIMPSYVRMYHNYAVAENFLVINSMRGVEPASLNVTGDIKVEEYFVAARDDSSSVKINAKTSEENVAGKSFPRIYGKGVFEAYVLLPKHLDGAYFTVTSANKDAVRVESKNGAWYVGNKKMRDFTENVWQILRIETDTDANKAIIKICGKIVGEAELTADYIDGFKIGINSNKDGVMWFDDITAKPYIDHEDYPSAPVANNDDEYNVGIHVCNLWHDSLTGEGWQSVTPFPELEPWLGYYDEGSSELADWELKIMAEHGIDFQHVCWYPPQNLVTTPIKVPDTSAAAIHDGYFNAKYSDKVKFCIMWENNSMKLQSSFEDFKEYIWKYWKEYYFSDPRYMTLDNKPILSIWVFNNFINFFGGEENAKKAVEFMRQDIKTLGFDDIILIVPRPNNEVETVEKIGLDGMFYYHYYKEGCNPDYQIDTLNVDKNESMHIIPTLAVGHNGIGRYDERSGIISIDGHKKVAEYIKNDYLTSKKTGTWMDNTLLVSNWNEYSEGHYIAPSADFGYGFLENVKDVFTNDKSSHESLDVKPTEAQKDRITKMHPATHQTIRLFRLEERKNDIKMKPLVSWDFSKEETYDKWSLISIEVDEKTSAGFKGHGTNTDPVIKSKNIYIDLSEQPVVHIRMKSSKTDEITVFFVTANHANYESDTKCKKVMVENVGEFTDYYIDMSDIKEWTGDLIGLRVDPANDTSAFEVELIELLVPAEKEISIMANGLEMEFDFPVVMKNGDIEVAASSRRGFFTMLNLYHVWDRFTGKLYVESKNHTLEYTVGSDIVVYDGKETDLGYTFTLRDGLPVIRLNKFCKMLGYATELKDGVLSIKSTDREPLNIYKNGDICWEFNVAGNTEGWTSYNTVLVSYNGELLVTNPAQSDVQMFSPDVNINANKYTKLAVGITVKPEEVNGKFFQMFFAFTGQNYNEPQSVKHYYDVSKMKEGQVYEFVIDLSENKLWSGIVSKLRVDYFDAMIEGKIDYIRFISSDNKQYADNLTEIKRIDFDSPEEAAGFSPANATMNVSNGHMNVVEVTNADPVVYWKNPGINADECNIIKVGVKVNKRSMLGSYFEVFFTTEEDTALHADKSLTSKYVLDGYKDGDLYELIFYMSNNKKWKGNVSMLRFDTTGLKGDVSVDYISFCKKNADDSEDIQETVTESDSLNWDFDEVHNNIVGGAADIMIQNGILSIINPTSPDFSAHINELEIDAEKVTKMIIGIEANKAAMEGKYLQVFFKTDTDDSLNEAKSIIVNYEVDKMTDGEIYPMVVDFSENDKWKGTVTKLRLDPFYYQAEAHIDYIYFE